jgi:hypothetical protein
VVLEILHAVGIDVAVAVNGREAVQRDAIQMALAEVLAALRDIEAVVTPACHPQ